MRFEALGIVGVSREIVAVGIALLEQDMHDRASERAVGAGQWREVLVGDLGGGGAVRVDDDKLAPRSFRAWATCAITLTWVETGLPPQLTIKSDLAISRPSMPRFGPTPASQPASVSALQIVECWRE